MIDAGTIIQGLLGAFGVVLWYLYTEQNKKINALTMDQLNYKVHVAETYVTSGQLTKAVENLNKTLENVSSGIIRVEQRLNNQIDNVNHRGGTSN